MKETESIDVLTNYSGGVDPLIKKRKKMGIGKLLWSCDNQIMLFVVAQNTFPDFLVSGVVPMIDGNEWNMVSSHLLIIITFTNKLHPS